VAVTLPSFRRNREPADRYRLLVLGAGPAGLLTAQLAASEGARVALVERGVLGGACFNTACIPSKTLIRTSRLYHEMRVAEHFGGRRPPDAPVDFAAAMNRVRRVRARLLKDTSARLSATGIDVFVGEGRFTGHDRMTVNGRGLSFDRALVATGARPVRPPIPGIEEAGYLTYESVFELSERPHRLLVIGGGPTGCELAQAFARLGSRVTLVQDAPMFLGLEERDAAQLLSDALARDGIDIHLDTQTTAVRAAGAERLVDLASNGERCTVRVDQILVSVGTTPNVESLGLDAAGVAFDPTDGIHVDDFLRTTNRRIFAAGDVCAGSVFPHIETVAAHIVVANALLLGRRRLSRQPIPWCTVTDPEIAHVGMYVTEARRKGTKVKTFTVMMHEVPRAIADGEEVGFVKLHVRERTGEILGATAVASHAGDLINEISLAMSAGLDLYALSRVNHPFPTQSQAIKLAALAGVRSLRSPFRTWLTKKWLSL
jgi:pyruvate/2-oxoglutarate dehydrogenase complex dihydrolipoamide dehydrogenase (E3) component